MIFDPATGSHLKPWLVRTLEPICDAEPGALADYILALLKHNVPESDMRKELAVQLDEFLEKECTPFIDTLFTVLRTKSYLPYGSTSPSTSYSSPNHHPMDTGIPIPLDGLLSPSIPTSPDRGQKRSNDNDERDGRPPAKGPRLSSEGQFSRYSNGRGQDTRSTGGWGGRGDRNERPGMNGQGEGVLNANLGMGGMNGGMGMNGSVGMGHANGRSAQPYQPPDQKRGICRDYHNNGYCARGAFCKYSHGEDAVIPGQLFPMNGPPIPGPLPFMPMFPNAGVPFGMAAAGGTYDPHEARMDMRPQAGGMSGPGRPQLRPPLLPRIQQEDGGQVVHNIHASGELPVIQDLTPNLSRDENLQKDDPEGFGSKNNQMGGMNGATDVEMAPIVAPPMASQGGFRGGIRGSGMGRSTFGSEVHKFRPERRHDKTLVIEKIPEDKMNLEHVNGWFKRFGTVTNVAIDVAKAKALVSFSNHDEAHAAWKSEDAVFNNRFVKLFWHRPMEGHGQVGARMLAASAPLVANMAKETPAPAPLAPAAQAAASVSSRKATMSSAAASALAAKQQLLEQQIAEQKSLMASLDTASPEEKKQIMTRLRKLGDEMKPTPASTDVPPAPTVLSQASKQRAMSTPRPDDHERRERERLDKELELHHASLDGVIEGNTEDLKAKLERLKAEAASLGLPEASSESSHGGGGGSYRPYRGRSRGVRSYYRGAARGGPPRASMKLDNRPKKLLIQGANDDNVPAVRDWYEATGQMESVETADNGIIVAFRTRAAAEQGLAKGLNIPTIGPVKVSWLNGTHSSTYKPTSSIVSLNNNKDDKSTVQQQAHHSPDPLLSPHRREEEVVASGWGGDGDGEEDGMGML